MDFTREPILETVITPKEGCKLVVRSSKSTAQEEHFVDAVEVISFGHSIFFRSLERPKTFLVPASDYEVLEVREARMVLKNVGIDRTIKIAGGREAQMKSHREIHVEKPEAIPEETVQESSVEGEAQSGDKGAERLDKKRDRRRNGRRRRGGREGVGSEESAEAEGKVEGAEPRKSSDGEESPLAQQVSTTSALTAMLAPPPRLISETIADYKDKFKEAFYSKTEEERGSVADAPGAAPLAPEVPLQQPEYGSFELSEEEEEEIYQRRKRQALQQENNVHHADEVGLHEQQPNMPFHE